MKKSDVQLNSKDKVKGIEDDQFFQIKDDFDQIRAHLGMYISRDQTDGALHLIKEAFNNSLDECNNKTSYWKGKRKKIDVTFLESNRSITIVDNGRGIPTDILVDAVMNKHTSTKTISLSESRNKKQTGLNGVGLTVMAALTDYMGITTYRGTDSKTIELIDGVLHEHPIEPCKHRTGTVTKIIPSEKYLGKIDLTTDLVADYLRNMSYIIEDDITITFYYESDKPSDALLSCTYLPQGLSATCKYMSSSLEFVPIEMHFSCDDYDISAAFSYDKTLDDTVTSSYCNYVHTTEGGCHEIAATKAICEFFSREGRKMDPNAKHEITYEDCRRGLIIAVNLEHIAPKFEGQHKTKVSNPGVDSEGKRGLNESLFTVMNNNASLMKRIIGYLRQVAKARMETHKIKGVTTKKTTSFLEDAEMEKYFPTSNRNSTGYRELFLAEGDSAAGSILNARNPSYQAVYTVAGVVDNCYNISVSQFVQKKIFRELIQILGCGVGKDFDASKVRFNKIIICTDSDVDGKNITSLVLCALFVHMRGLFDAGLVYKALPPLYLMDLRSLRKYYDGREWCIDKQEYYNIINTVIVNNVEFAMEEPGKVLETRNVKSTVLNKNQFQQWLEMNSEYKIELDNLGRKVSSHPTILEMVCHMKNVCKNEMDFKVALTKLYPEMSYDTATHSFMGAWNQGFYSLICDHLFDRVAVRFQRELQRNESPMVWWKPKKKDVDMVRGTIGEFYHDVERMFDIKIDQRFKGLGEAEPKLLFQTTTNPQFRTLIQFNINDPESVDEIFELLHGKSEKLRDARRDMLANADFSPADIDN